MGMGRGTGGVQCGGQWRGLGEGAGKGAGERTVEGAGKEESSMLCYKERLNSGLSSRLV